MFNESYQNTGGKYTRSGGINPQYLYHEYEEELESELARRESNIAKLEARESELEKEYEYYCSLKPWVFITSSGVRLELLGEDDLMIPAYLV